MGIVQVRNIRNNRVYLAASANTAGTILKPGDDPAYDHRDDLKALETMWLEKLKPVGERGYH